MQAEPRDRVGRRKLPSRKDRLHDFETVRNPVDALQQCSFVHARSWGDRKLEDDLRLYLWPSGTNKRERIADLGEVVYRAVVNVSSDRFMYVALGPSRAIREANLAPHRQLPARLTHLPHCDGYTVRIVEIERGNPRGEWLDLTASIEGAERLGSNRLNLD